MTSVLNHSRTALLYSKNELFHRIQYSCIERSSAAIMWNKIGWKSKIKKNRTVNVQMFRAIGCNQITFPATRNAAWIKLEIYVTDTCFAVYLSSCLFMGRNTDWEYYEPLAELWLNNDVTDSKNDCYTWSVLVDAQNWMLDSRYQLVH